ncbi:LysR family transcriptional regulator [Kitasatospora sp. RB6PN24]|uniref:LysR substrate-binding domain-containing protein n=1 Tax=Kitasatospora humi TaxID=2893891 RepID=UPI001E2F7F71|nr:LysR family transcriptional regulator [Kitasatospora humi]MCC9310026.1 LysR family transcriptional regulator [Kitasatospora humi]
MRLELRHLQMLCAMADCGSVGRAAGLLGYSQQALSGQLQRIEAHFGQPLFRRTACGIEPTGYGAAIVTQARDVVTRVGAIGGHAASGAAQEADRPRSLRLATTGSPLLAGLVTRVRDRLGELPLNVTSVHRPATAAELLERGAVDVVLGVDHPGRAQRLAPSLAHLCVATEPLFIAMSAGHRLRHRLEVRLAELAEDSWFLTPDNGAGWPAALHDACAADGFTPAAVHDYLGDQQQLQLMVAQGMGVTVTHATVRAIPGVLVKPLAGSPLWCRHLLAWQPEAVTRPVLEVLRASAVAAHRQLLAQAPHFQAWIKRTYQVRTAVEADWRERRNSSVL